MPLQNHTIYNMGYTKLIAKDDPFYGENLETKNAFEDGISAPLIISGGLTGNLEMVDGHIKSRNYVEGVSGWIIRNDGFAQFKDVDLTGGEIKYQKENFGDASKSGYYIGPDGIHIGAAMDATYFKYNIGTGALDYVGDISGRASSVLANAINASGNLVTDVINTKFNTSTEKILAEFEFEGSGALKIATDSNNGLWISPTGILAKKAGDTTLTITNDGDATFSGSVVGADIFGTTITGGFIQTAYHFKVITALNSTNPSALNDDYHRDGSQANRPAYTNDGTYWIWWDNGDKYWKISNSKGGGTVYFRHTFTERDTPITLQWTEVNGTGSNFRTNLTAEDSQQVTINEGNDGDIRIYDDLSVLGARLRPGSFHLRDLTETLSANIGWDKHEFRIIANNDMKMRVGTNKHWIYGADVAGITISQGPFRPGISSNNPRLGNNDASGQRWSRLYCLYNPDVSSSIKNKEEVENITYGLKDILKLRPVEYKTKGNKEEIRGKGKEIGLILEEVETVIPEITGKSGYAPSDLIPVLIKAIQELNEEVEKLKNKLK